MGTRSTFNPYNRLIANVTEVMSLTNNPLNTVLFVSTAVDNDLKAWSGSVTESEIETAFSGQTDYKNKISTAISQVDVGGNDILPSSFYTAGKLLTLTGVTETDSAEVTAFKNWFETKLKNSGAVMVVFDDCSIFQTAPELVSELNTILNSQDCWALVAVEEKEHCDTFANTTRFAGIRCYETSTDVYEKIADAAFVGRVIFMGVGEVDGEAKELVGPTPDTEDTLTVTEAQSWVNEKNCNVYVTTVDDLNETSGLILFSGNEFINAWELLKVKTDLRSDLVNLRHNSERLGVSDIDEGNVHATIVTRMNKLIYSETTGEGLLADYRVTKTDLDRTLEDNAQRFEFKIEVSLRGIGKWFTLDIIGYTDGRTFSVEEA